MKEEKKDLYDVWIVKYNDEPISVLTTDKYDEAYERWTSLKDDWVSAIKDKVPFILTKPIVSAFDPASIKEITVRPVMKVAASKYENPYHEQMLKNGLTKTLRNSGNILTSEILDEGYNG